ncbi:MAG TPA: SEC-C metal-binding domain-containing protein [Kofleriaceae bacterium]
MITSDPDRLAKVADELGIAIREAQAGARVRLPVVAHEDAAGLVMVMHRQLDAAITERSEEARAQGHVIACGVGCNACCTAPVLVSEGESIAVAEWLAEHPDVAARFATAYRAWKKGIGETGRAVEQARTDEARAAAARAMRKNLVMCAFNQDGACTIYDARPARCRMAHALGSPDACSPEGGGQVQYFQHERTEETFAEQEPMRGALHHALRPNAGLELLCSSVFRMLFARSPRNGPCPCGSGKRFKHCCA